LDLDAFAAATTPQDKKAMELQLRGRMMEYLYFLGYVGARPKPSWCFMS